MDTGRVGDPALRFKAYWEGLTREGVARIGEHYTEDAYFRDPFNEVRGLAEVRRIFEHMFETLHEPRFRIRRGDRRGRRASSSSGTSPSG